MPTVLDRAAKYAAKMPPAISGSGGHQATFAVACVLVKGFKLDDKSALRILTEVHNPMCLPPWSQRELHHKVRSALRHCKRVDGYLANGRQPPHRSLTRDPDDNHVPPATYGSLAAALIDLCPWVDNADTHGYVVLRNLVVEGSHAQLGGLPRPADQARIVGQLLKTFEPETLAKAGLLWRDRRTNTILTERFAHCEHRLLIPWRNLDGSIQIVQRRRLDDVAPRYVFPQGLRPLMPFGAERLRSTDPNATLVVCEGAIDVLALRLLAHRDQLNWLVLGLPGAKAWQPDWARFAKSRVVCLALDADDTGSEAAESIAADAYQAGAINVKRITPRAGQDWAEHAQQSPPGVRFESSADETEYLVEERAAIQEFGGG